MGALGVSGKTGEDHIDSPAAVEGDQPAGEAEPQGEFVPAAALVPESPTSRRDRQWRERVEQHLKPIKEEWTQKEQTYQQQLEAERRERQQQAEELARMRGAIETMQRQPQQTQQAAPRLDPEKLYAEADAALEANDIRTYNQKNRAAARLEAEIAAEAKVAAARQEFERRIPAQLPPHIQTAMYQNQHVAAAGEKGIRAVIRMEQELEDDGMPPGPARTQKAFQLVNEKLGKAGKAPARPAYSQDSAAALAGIPTGRAPAGGGRGSEEGVRLTAAESAAAKAAGMSAEEFTKWKDPHRYGLIKG